MIYLQRLNLSCTIDPRTPIKIKIGGKILSPKTCQNNLLSPHFGSLKFSLRPLTSLIQKMFFSISSLKHNLITDSNGANFIKPFLAIILILCPLKTPEASRFPGIFKGYKMGTLARNESI